MQERALPDLFRQYQLRFGSSYTLTRVINTCGIYGFDLDMLVLLSKEDKLRRKRHFGSASVALVREMLQEFHQ